MVLHSAEDQPKDFDYAYNEFIKSHPRKMLTAIDSFQQELQKSNFKFGKTPIPTFMKPHFLEKAQNKHMNESCDAMVQMVDRLVNLYDTNPLIRNMYQLSPEAEELVGIDPGYKRTAVVVRLDCFVKGSELKFMELNCDSPAGMGYSDCGEEILFNTKELDEFFSKHHIIRSSRVESLLDALLGAYEEFGGDQTPHIAIIDWKTVRTKPEFEIIKSVFEKKGYKTIIADPRDLRYKGGKLYHGDFRIDLIYRRVIFSELLDHLRDCSDFIKAYQDKAVCVVNPLRSRLASSKALLSVFTNPGNDHLFSAKENEIKKNHIPWTRRVFDAEKFYGGKKIYLVDFLKDEKETLVLKPSDGYGGKDVTIGCETVDKEWNRVIDKALKSNWVVQEYVPQSIFSVPEVVNKKIEFQLKKMNTNTFVFGGKAAGSFSRVSDESVINVSRGGWKTHGFFRQAD